MGTGASSKGFSTYHRVRDFGHVNDGFVWSNLLLVLHLGVFGLMSLKAANAEARAEAADAAV